MGYTVTLSKYNGIVFEQFLEENSYEHDKYQIDNINVHYVINESGEAKANIDSYIAERFCEGYKADVSKAFRELEKYIAKKRDLYSLDSDELDIYKDEIDGGIRLTFISELGWQLDNKIILDLDGILSSNGLDAYFDADVPGRYEAYIWER